MSQLDKWMVGGKISKLVIVITDKDTGEHVERWQFDVQIFKPSKSSKSKTKAADENSAAAATPAPTAEKTEQEIISKGAAKAVSEYERSLNSSVEPKAYQYGLVGQTNAPGGYPPMAADPFARPATPSSAHGHHRPMSMSGQQLAPGPYGSRPGTPRSPGYNMPPPGNMSPSGHMSPAGNMPPRGHSPSGSFAMPPPMMPHQSQK